MKKLKYLFIILLFTSCAVKAPNYLYKMESYKVTEVKRFYATAENDEQKIKVRNFDLNVGDTLYNWYVIPVVKF